MRDEEDPTLLVNDLRNPLDLKCYGLSNWLYNDGRPSSLRQCEVLEFDTKKQVFLIKWLHNAQTKYVSRFNIIFELEDKMQLEHRISEAQNLRDIGQVLIKYHYMVSNMQLKDKPALSDATKTRISYRIISLHPQKPVVDQDRIVQIIHRDFQKHGLSFQSLSRLFEEQERLFLRCAQCSAFEAELPYNEENIALFKSIIPEEKFVPPSQRCNERMTLGRISIPTRSIAFGDLVSNMKSILFQACPSKLTILSNVNSKLHVLSHKHFFDLRKTNPQSIKECTHTCLRQTLALVGQMREHILDSQYEISALIAKEAARVHRVNEERSVAASHKSATWKKEYVAQSFYQVMRQLSVVVNLRYETGLRECFERSIQTLRGLLGQAQDHLEESLGLALSEDVSEISFENIVSVSHDSVLDLRISQNIFQIEMTLAYNKSSRSVELQPSSATLMGQFVGVVRGLATELQELPCIHTTETGFARVSEPEGRSKVFPDCLVHTVEESIDSIHAALVGLLRVPEAVKAQISSHSKILSQDPKKYEQWLKSDGVGVGDYAKELARLATAKGHIERLLFEPTLRTGLIVLNCGAIKAEALAKIADLQERLFRRIKKRITRTSKQIQVEVQAICAAINKEKIRDIEELCEVKEYVRRIPEEKLRIAAIITDIQAQIALLEQYFCRQTEEDIADIWQSFSEPLKIAEDVGDCLERFAGLEKTFLVQLRQANEQLQKDFDECRLDFELLQGYEALYEYGTAANRCDLLEDKIEGCLAWAELSNRREDLFEVKKTDFQDIGKLRAELQPYSRLWNLARDYFYKINLWMKGPLCDIERDQLTDEVTDACSQLLKLQKVDFQDRRTIAVVAMDLRKLYESFRPYLPLVWALRSPYLRPRHWESIVSLRAPPLEIEQDLHQSLEEIIDKDGMKFVEEINEIGHFAGRETKLEQQVQAMKDEWKNIKFELIPFKESGTYLLHKPEPIWDLLDEHILRTLAISNSPYVKFLKAEVNYWKGTLIRVQEILEEWAKVQRGWLYLQPIFTSPDFQSQLPTVAASFLSVDKHWRAVMHNTLQNPHVLDACFQGRLIEGFQSSNETLERVEKGLAAYLAQKRVAFPRFFFLPNDDLLQILSQARSPEQVQPHLSKIFEGISRLDISQESGQVLGMSSSLGEQVSFSNPVSTQQKQDSSEEGLEGAQIMRRIEEWLVDVEVEMRTSLRDQLQGAQTESRNRERSEWLFKWPAQLILSLDQCRWTSAVEEGMLVQSQDPQAPTKVLKQEEKSLRELVALTRSLPPSSRHAETLGALIVLGVHSKDVTAELLKNGVRDPQEFEWINQLRHYFLHESPSRGAPAQLELETRMVSAARRYGFEYLGNQPRLVITPLTDRCYRTLMVALQLHLGGAPEGPAGTGKTETTKDLAKALAKQCLVFNCSEQLEVETMGKFFRGLACCGAWACFDEFNRIEVEVLSVVASQILQIQTALMRRRPRAPFEFEGDTLMMDPTCAVFITMNPGYAGRSELPDNLKTLFRPVAMMVPNYAMIAEISLYSFGFQKARELSLKITMSLKLASEQLSTQLHYDYGMRAVKSIILAAGRRKAESHTDDEEHLAWRSISESSLPKLVAEDVPLFMAILSDLFPGTERQPPDYSELLAAIRDACKARGLESAQEFEEKAIQLFQTQEVRHGLMLVGGTMSGKTQIIHALAQALGSLKAEQLVLIDSVNPKAVTIGQLYGDFDPLTHEWSDGILAHIVRESASDTTDNKHWIILDGPVDAVWIENLNTVLDDNKKLCLPSGEIIKFNSRMTMVFEVEDLQEASPATVSRCGMIYLTPEKLGWRVQTKPWLRSLPLSLRSEWRAGLLSSLIEALVPPLLKWLLESDGRGRLVHPGISANQLMRQFLDLLEAFLLKEHTRATLAEKEQGERDKQEAKEAAQRLGLQNEGVIKPGVALSTLANIVKRPDAKLKKREVCEVVNLFLMAAAWGFGALLSSENARSELSGLLIRLAEEHPEVSVLAAEDFPLPRPGMSLHDEYYDLNTREWARWADKLAVPEFAKQGANGQENSKEQAARADLGRQAVLIPTEDTLRFTYLLEQHIKRSMPICLMGDTGTGKTAIMRQLFAEGSSATENCDLSQIFLSATTSARSLQSLIGSKLEKQRRGVFGPKAPNKRLIMFIDDMGMPAKEKYGAQPPLELIRTFMADNELYEPKSTIPKKVVDVLLVSAIGLPTGGRTFPTSRLLRQFSLLSLPALSAKTMHFVFSRILDQGMLGHDPAWRSRCGAVAALSIALYQRVLTVLRPTPAKSHYQFNVRQMTELTQGILMFLPKNVCSAHSKLELLGKLWIHESRRVFTDRLVNEEDAEVVQAEMRRVIQEAESDFAVLSLLEQPQAELLFCNFNEPNLLEYSLIKSRGAVAESLRGILELYNQANSKSKLSGLQLFTYMIEHLSRISRILQKPQGHGLLVSLGGNGRSTLTKLASFINSCQIFGIDVAKSQSRIEWLDDMKTLFKKAGLNDQPQVFALAAEQARSCQGSLEDVGSIVNTGEVPNLFSLDDLEEINSEIGRQYRAASQEDNLKLFSKLSKANVHVLLSISPAGDDLRELIRSHPGLVHCTIIDWFLPWPEEALASVATAQLTLNKYLSSKLGDLVTSSQAYRGLSNNFILAPSRAAQSNAQPPGNREKYAPGQQVLVTETLPAKGEVLREITQVFVEIYQSVVRTAEQVVGQHVYITPSKFNEALLLFEELISAKSSRLEQEKDQYLTGIRKLDEANITIDKLKEQLKKLGPELEEKGRAVEAGMVLLEKEAKEAEKTEQAVGKEAEIVAEQKSIAENIQKECQLRLQEAQPQFEAALLALRTLKVSDFVTMKSFLSPPQPIRLALEAACIMLGLKPRMVDQSEGKSGKKVKVPDYWEKSRKLLNDYKKFIASLENYDKDKIPAERMASIQSYLDDPEFVPEKIRKASEAAEGICKWVIAVCKYSVVAKEVEPRRKALQEAQARLEATEADFEVKQQELRNILAQRDSLAAKQAQQTAERQSLMHQRDHCLLKLHRAGQLMTSLGSERGRWELAVETLGLQQRVLLGDMVLAACVISYLGPFEASIRDRLVQGTWAEIIKKRANILANPKFDLRDAIGNEESMQRWQLFGIPNDSVSYQNMIILEATESRKWPLLIDPQDQALVFMREYLDHDYVPIKAISQNFNSVLKLALEVGATVICQNVGSLEGPAELLSLLKRDVHIVAGDPYINFGDELVEFHEQFRLLMFSNFEKPQFTPQVQARVQLLNFSVTQEGLEEQLLSLVCKSECHKEEEEKYRLRRQDLEFRDQRRQIEKEILVLLRNAGEDILEDDQLVSSLDQSKRITDDILHKLTTAEYFAQKIEDARKAYTPVAVHGTRLFFVIRSLSQLDPMYYFSMAWFRDLFSESLAKPEETAEVERNIRLRGTQLMSRLRSIVFQSVSMSLFSHHQTLFSFLLAIKVNAIEERDFTEQKASKGVKSSSDESIGKNLKRHAVKPNEIQSLQDGPNLGVCSQQLNYLLTGILPPDLNVEGGLLPAACSQFLDEKRWRRVLELSTFACFKTLPREIELNPLEWRDFIRKDQISDAAGPVLPKPYSGGTLSEFSAILLWKVLKPERVTSQIRSYIAKALGWEFVSAANCSLQEVYEQRSKPSTPMLLLLTPGNDPMESIQRLGEIKQRIPYHVSLGKGQSEKAKALITEVWPNGGWIVLQNCHLAPSFMQDLVQIVDQLQPQIKTRNSGSDNSKKKTSSESLGEQRLKAPHPEFRLWLTSMSCKTFPQFILQNSIKYTSEPPQGIKQSLVRTLGQMLNSKPDRQLYDSSSKRSIWQPLFLSLAFFHAVVRERRVYGSLGWNCHYDFNDSDFRISMRQLHLMIETSSNPPLKALQYLTAECNYGGRVTDDRDRRTILTLLEDFYCQEVLSSSQGGYNFCGTSDQNTQRFKVKHCPDLESCLEYARGLPDECSPLVVGLHPNATINLAILEADRLLGQVLCATKPSSLTSSDLKTRAASPTAGHVKLISQIKAKVRSPFDEKLIRDKFPFSYGRSMNVVLVQEASRYNRLLGIIHQSLKALILALKGEVVSTADTEATLSSILSNCVPERWLRKSYPSVKPLTSWIEDLKARTDMLDLWISLGGKPEVVWISGLYFPQSFLTAIKQDYARKFSYPIDQIDIRPEVGSRFQSLSSAQELQSAEGSHWVSGLHLQGARWSVESQVIAEPQPGVTVEQLPCVLLSPSLNAQGRRHPRDTEAPSLYRNEGLNTFDCPVYRTSARAGTLSTTGHSTNYVMAVPLPTSLSPGHWVKRGAALLLATDD